MCQHMSCFKWFLVSNCALTKFLAESIQVGFNTAEADVGAPGGVRRGTPVAARADIPRGGARRGPDSRPAHVPAVHGAGESGRVTITFSSATSFTK